MFATLHRVFLDLHLAIEVLDVFSQVQQLGMVPARRIGELPCCQRGMLGQADSPGQSLGCWSYQGQGLAPRCVFDDPVLAPLVLNNELPVSTAEELLRESDTDSRRE